MAEGSEDFSYNSCAKAIPGESVVLTRNLAKVKNHSGRLDQLKKTLKAFQVRTKDPWLIMWDNDAQLQGSGTGL